MRNIAADGMRRMRAPDRGRHRHEGNAPHRACEPGIQGVQGTRCCVIAKMNTRTSGCKRFAIRQIYERREDDHGRRQINCGKPTKHEDVRSG